MAYIDETGLAEVTTKLKTYIDNKAGGGGVVAKIRCAEMPDVTITLSQNGTDIESKTTPATTGGIVDFDVDTVGTYTLTATGTGITTWTHNVDVEELNTIIECKAGILNNYTKNQIHTACQGGYAHNMWSVQDQWTYVKSGDLFNNTKLMIAQFYSVDGKDQILWAHASQTSATYQWNPYMSYLTSASATAWTRGSSTYGGCKYSALRRLFMKQGDEVYSQATGILPDDYSGTLTTGVKFSELVYSDTQVQCPIYSYNCVTDTMTLLTDASLTAPSNTAMMFIKGYFKSVGTIDETTFNNGIYYTYTSSDPAYVYTKATTYNSSTTYYGLYETMQEDGAMYSGYSDLQDIMIKITRTASAGGIQTTKVSSYSDYISPLSVEEITGLNRDMTLPSGATATSANAYNIAGEGTKLDGFDFRTQATGTIYWTASANSSYNYNACSISKSGGIISNYSVNYSYAVRPCFRTS